MRFSIRLNNDLPIEQYVAIAQAAEAAGFDQLWVSHDLFLRSAPVILSACALATERIQLGTCILNPYTMHPSEIAMLAATLDELSGGGYLDHLGYRADAETEIDTRCLRDFEPHLRTFGGGESGRAAFHAVAAGIQRGDGVESYGVSGDVVDHACIEVSDLDLGAGNDCAGGIRYGALDGAGALRERKSG